MTYSAQKEAHFQLKCIEERLEHRTERIDSKLDATLHKLGDVVSEMVRTRQEYKSLRYWLVGSALTILAGLASFNATLLSNMVASFDSGRNTAEMVVESRKQAQESTMLLKELKAQIETLASSNTSSDAVSPTAHAPADTVTLVP